jgi:glycosyltransferase involved in cell wall biosynthesis
MLSGSEDHIRFLSAPFSEEGKGLANFMAILFNRIIYVGRVIRLIRRLGVNVVVVQQLWNQYLPLIALPISIIRPTVIRWTGGALRSAYRRSRTEYYARLALLKLVTRRCFIVLPREDIEQHLFLERTLGMDRKRILEIGYIECIEDDIFGFSEPKTIRKDELTVSCVGRIEDVESIQQNIGYEKDPFKLLDIVARVMNRRPEIKLRFVGRGTGTAQLRKRILAYGLEGRISMMGQLPKPQLADVFRTSDLTFVAHPLTSLMEQSLAVCESFMCGTPVAAFARWDNIETEQPGGFLINYRDATKAAEQLSIRLDREYLSAKRSSLDQIVAQSRARMDSWGGDMASVLKKAERQSVGE